MDISLTKSIQKCNKNGYRRSSDVSRDDSALHQMLVSMVRCCVLITFNNDVIIFFRPRQLPVKVFSISTTMATNYYSTEYVECSGSESDKSDKNKPLKKAVIKTFFNIFPKKRKRGRPQKTKNPELSPNDNQ